MSLIYKHRKKDAKCIHTLKTVSIFEANTDRTHLLSVYVGLLTVIKKRRRVSRMFVLMIELMISSNHT